MVIDFGLFLTVYPKTQILKETFSRDEHWQFYQAINLITNREKYAIWNKALSLGTGEKKGPGCYTNQVV